MNWLPRYNRGVNIHKTWNLAVDTEKYKIESYVYLNEIFYLTRVILS